MRILFIFCDMLRPGMLRSFNSDLKNDEPLDHWLKKIGGTAFTNCYTEGIDTARGLACVYTGKIPKNNGCYKRLHWPGFYLNEGIYTVFDLFDEKRYKTLIKIDEDQAKCGELPDRKYKNTKIVHDLGDFIKNLNDIKHEKNIFCFLELIDYHWAMDDYGHSIVGNRHGQKHLSNAFDMVFKNADYNIFDYIFIFSDHGCRFDTEISTEDIDLLKDNRSKIVMFVHKKGDADIEKNSSIRALTDILPTLADITHSKIPAVDGISLFKDVKNRYVVLEDHNTFTNDIQLLNRVWGIRTDKYFYLEDLDSSRLLKVVSDFKYEEVKNPNASMIKDFQNKIKERSSSYKEVKKLHDTQKKYVEFITNGCIKRETYSDGSRRITNVASFRKNPKLLLESIRTPKKMVETSSDIITFIKRKAGKIRHK